MSTAITFREGELTCGDGFAMVHATGNASVVFGPLTLCAPAADLEAWLAVALGELRVVCAKEKLLHPARLQPRTQRMADALIPGDILLLDDGRWRKEIDRVDHGDRITVWFVGDTEPMVLHPSTMVHTAVRDGDEMSGEPFVADRKPA